MFQTHKKNNTMTLKQKADNDNQMMKLLKITHISHILATTDKGVLALRLDKGGNENDYYFTLDAVPLDAQNNKEMMQFLGI